MSFDRWELQCAAKEATHEEWRIRRLWEKLAEMDEGRRVLEAWKREQQRRIGRVRGFGVDEQCLRGSRQVEA